ncbi:DUF2520 domain-containing protein [Microbacterium murale]|uniref:Short-subunit dehydrogenase-like oxidoreductase (DUF2520 family) n=1 Tax=Microbacterium murale TaxID=1081040 RepID=A0ABU0P8Z2_9MICO|nr:DUF2520 domain-containing protein [Microbacterium murale]MDQ0643785.1 putative short-subunit dehydrogenase-like oxidoreductase (DUF2520 family) [Microbacterium murale]
MNSPSRSLPSSGLPAATSVAIIGAGRVGGVLAAALRQAGLTVHGPFGRGETIPMVEVALLCVPDSAIADASAAVRDRVRYVGHVSGATPLDDVDFSIHPLQTFTGSESPDIFLGIGAAVAGRTPADTYLAEQLARALGARPFEIDAAHRAGYHAAASFASNFVLTVLDAAEQLAASAGIPDDEARDLLAPLIRRTVDNWQSMGATASLTGPIARGDEVTIARQRAAVDEADPALTSLFDALATATRAVAGQKAAV